MLGDHILDLVLVALVVLFAVSGYRQGFIIGALSFVGFVGGGVLGILFAPPIARAVLDDPSQQALLAIVIAFLAATLGQLLASSLGATLRSQVTWESARSADAVGGAVVSALSLLIVAWFIGSAVVNSPFAPVRKQVSSSTVLQSVDKVMPDAARTWFSSFRSFVASTEFPQVFGGLGGESIANVPPPDESVLNTPQLRAARRSVVKILGTAPECDRRIEGSGFVYARDRVMTNAHVVAGVRGSPSVIAPGGGMYRGRVVLYDPKRDVAVLYVPDLPLSPLKFDNTARFSDSAVIAGYPKNRPLTTRAARVGAKQQATGLDIYRASQVKREIYSVRGLVEQGNSGGPLLASDGGVYGVIFAAAFNLKDTGYALTAAEVMSDAEAGRSRSAAVSTQACSD